ncbi:sugar ABC transporter ATP-binding protein [Catenulispora subtropica]|uniref:Sugar ABC transporter ATP-binding protein n=1 Tax=Catenulispora subtropica TaxID=450798 RepID=A0ABN2RDP0_9ACTN
MPVVLDVENVSKGFPGVRALDRVSLGLRSGRAHGLVGENGAGKSTLIKVLTGVYRPDSGVVRLGGTETAFTGPADAQRAGISTIHQEVDLIPLMSVARNVFLGREPRNRFGLIDGAALNAAAAELLARYGVRADVRRPLGGYGLGTQQMVALARAMSFDARVVVMDEPTSSLEPREVATLFEVVDRLKEDGVAVCYVSHRMDELYRLCDDVTVLRDGRRVHTGELAGLKRVDLVALMLGRDSGELRAHGATAFSGEHHADGEPVLRASGLVSRPRVAGVSVEVRPGEVVGLAGLLGSGRSETARAIAGSAPRQAGSVEVAGTRVAGGPGAAIRAGVSMLAEDRKADGIIPNLSIRENIVLAALPRLSRGGVVSRARQDRVVATFMTRLRIKASSAEQKVGELSGGNQQKVLLARALCLEPKVLLLDEPTRGIDVGAKAEVQALIDELAGQGLGVLLISSDTEELIEGADRLVVLRDGTVSGQVPPGRVTEAALLAALAAEEPDVSEDPDVAQDPDVPEEADRG